MIKRFYKYIKEGHIDIDPFGEEDWSDKNQYTYDEFYDLASDEVLDKFHYEYMRYSEDMGAEDYYYGSIKYWMSLM